MAGNPYPFRAFRFLVEFEGSKTASAAFSQFSGIKFKIQTFRARSGDDNRGVTDVVAAKTEFEPVTLTKGVVGDEEFLNWLFSAAASLNSGPVKMDTHVINIVALDDKGNRGVTWTLRNAVPVGYELSPMDGGRSEVLSESVTFEIDGVERRTHTPSQYTNG